MSKGAHDPICSMARTILAILSPEDSVVSRGLSRSTKELIKLAHKILSEDNPQTLRHLHYAIFNLASINYKNDIASYRRLSTALTATRRRYRQFGADAAAVELEALPAAELKRRVNSAIHGLIDRKTWRRQAHIQEVELASIADFTARMKNLPLIGGSA
jgi:hypothetical protein